MRHKPTFAILLLLAVLFAGYGTKAQIGNLYLADTTIHIYEGGTERTLAWCGGFSNAQFAMADLDHDGLKDLVIFEWRDRWVRTFLNRGSAMAAVWQYAPHYADNFYFPTVRDSIITDYLKLEDYNRDGIADLIQKGPQGFAIYKGYYNSANELAFKFYKDLRYVAPDNIGDINAYTQASDIPGVIDVDGDGDLDFFGYDVNGGLLSFYKNCQVEHGLPKDSIVVCNPTRCWGHTFQTYLRTYVLSVNPSSASGATCPTIGTFGCIRQPDGTQMYKETRHSGNCMLLFDVDGDGDVDMLDGNISFPDLQLLINGRAQYGGTDSMIAQDSMWQAAGHKVRIPNWPSPFYVDADGDGKRDILVTPHDIAGVENYRTILFYKNTGTATSPVFTYQNDTFLVDKTVDAGSGSYPVLYDFNRDGKLDLFVGSEGYFDPSSSTLKSRISYYQNGGSSAPSNLQYVTGDFLGIGAQGFSGAAPAFGDLDGDGKEDMVIGHTDGTLSFYKNTATTNYVQPVWVLDQRMLKSTANDTINVGAYASPYIYDINKDGKPDLLIGNQTGQITYYSGAATGSGPQLTWQTDSLGNIRSDTSRDYRTVGYSSIWIGKMDNTNTEYLLSGNNRGWIVRYTGFQGGNVSTPYTLLDAGYSGIKAGYRSTVTAGDINGDGRYEMIVGNYHGGLNLYKQGPRLDAGSEAMRGAGCSIYPNPAAGVAVLSWPAGFAAGDDAVHISLYNAVGALSYSGSAHGDAGAASLPLSGLPSGMYLCRIVSGGGRVAVLKLSVIQ